jgi:hypothetical protein
MTEYPNPPLRAGYEAEWAQLNREEAEQLRASNMALSPTQRLQVGQKLSQQAVSLLAASIGAGHISSQVLWSDDPPDLKRLMTRS